MSEDHEADYRKVDQRLEDLLRQFMRWIHRQLEIDYDEKTSDDALEELSESNDWHFDERVRYALSARHVARG